MQCLPQYNVISCMFQMFSKVYLSFLKFTARNNFEGKMSPGSLEKKQPRYRLPECSGIQLIVVFSVNNFCWNHNRNQLLPYVWNWKEAHKKKIFNGKFTFLLICYYPCMYPSYLHFPLLFYAVKTIPDFIHCCLSSVFIFRNLCPARAHIVFI